jgi:hypothetical protein
MAGYRLGEELDTVGLLVWIRVPLQVVAPVVQSIGELRAVPAPVHNLAVVRSRGPYQLSSIT